MRVWIAGGKQDAIIAPAETERLVDLLQAAGAKVSAHFFDAGHGLTKEEFVLAQPLAGPVAWGADPGRATPGDSCRGQRPATTALHGRLAGGLSLASSNAARSHFPRIEAAS